MIKLRQHVPMFVNDGEGGWVVEAPILSELLALPEVARYAQDVELVERRGQVSGLGHTGRWITIDVIHPAPEAQRFHRWSLSGNRLMVEHNQGDMFWVVGSITADDPAELSALPPFVETETARLRREAWNRGDMGPAPRRYRCAEHGAEHATCCLRDATR